MQRAAAHAPVGSGGQDRGERAEQPPLVTWLVEYVPDIATKHLVGKDGRTSYERLFGKPLREEALEFGEKVMWRHQREKDYSVTIDPRWSCGVWLGRTWGTMRHRVAISSDEVI